MTRGESTQSKVHFKGEHDDFLVFVDDVEVYKKWLKDSSIPLTHFVSTFQVFCTHKQGAQGTYDTASKSMLASEFGSNNVDEAMMVALRKGTLQNMEMPGRQGPRNESMSSMQTK